MVLFSSSLFSFFVYFFLGFFFAEVDSFLFLLCPSASVTLSSSSLLLFVPTAPFSLQSKTLQRPLHGHLIIRLTSQLLMSCTNRSDSSFWSCIGLPTTIGYSVLCQCFIQGLGDGFPFSGVALFANLWIYLSPCCNEMTYVWISPSRTTWCFKRFLFLLLHWLGLCWWNLRLESSGRENRSNIGI